MAHDAHDEDLPTVRSLDEVAELVDRHPSLYVRWSKGPVADSGRQSKDGLTGIRLPGLSANPMAVEEWWGDRPLRTWVARRLVDYEHLRVDRGPGVHAWLLEGEERGRGPDNEPLVECRRPVAWIADQVLEDAQREVAAASEADDWGPLKRR